ncbi:hypothetical protein H5410_026030 [Solanum commersonii]|uniref:Uncharacterized protein n=1 Tax=Solanum commersonii TaxID=4109 RepID=A0A9J5YVX0_SOLCO|nr:hypothetical protein H5410_026030 [Solanum commersonii]
MVIREHDCFKYFEFCPTLEHLFLDYRSVQGHVTWQQRFYPYLEGTHMARCKHKGGQADGKKQHVLGVIRNLVDASTGYMARTLLNRCCIRIKFFKCTTFGVSDTKSPSNIASRKSCSSKCISKKKGIW